MLFRLSLKNLKKSIRDYSIYFFTLILGVSIFYVFNSIGAQTAMMELSKTKADSIDMLKTVISSMSVMVSFILGFLIVYASRFLIRKRKKEFGVYLAEDIKDETAVRRIPDTGNAEGGYLEDPPGGDCRDRSTLPGCGTGHRDPAVAVHVSVRSRDV